jgi:hypothetical protein
MLCTWGAAAQEIKPTYRVTPGDSLYEDMKAREQLLMQERYGRPFPLYGNVRSADGVWYDFNHITRPAVIMAGHAACLPCTIQLPLLARLSRQRKYRDIDFIYITPDSRETVLQETGKKGYGKVKIFTFGRRYIIDTMHTVSVFPTVYFIDRKGIARVITAGGRTDTDAVPYLQKKWNDYIDTIRKE